MGLFKKLIARFSADERGVFAVIFGVVAIVLVVMGGAALDYVSVQNARGATQTHLDATTLALHSQIDSKSETEIEVLATGLLNERLGAIGIVADVEQALVDTDEGTLFIEARINVPTHFLALIGIQSMYSRLHSEVTSKSLNIEVALVLDSTGSMAGPKLAALQSSANLLVSELMPEADNPDIKITVVPFNRYVNIGMGNRNEAGLDIPADYQWTRPGQNCYDTYPDSTLQCDWNLEDYNCDIDGVPSICQRWVSSNCTGSLGDPVEVCEPYNARDYRWFGCMGSRNLVPLDTQDDTYMTDPVPGVMRHWNSCRVTPISELTSIRADVQNGINSMVARDKTYIPSGLMWGWRLLSPGIPFTGAAPYGPENKKIIVLMTDGQNTISASTTWSPADGSNHRVHRGGNVNAANAKTAEICANVLNEDIVIYTIAFEVSDPAIQTILQNCAGNGGSYFDANNPAELQAAFAEIADDLKTLRVSQ